MFKKIMLTVILLNLGLAPPAVAAPKVLASILPIQSLAAGVMAGVGQPRLLVRGPASPHAYAMRPSDARALAAADLIFWIGPELENFLIKPLSALARRARIIQLSKLPDVRRQARTAAHGHGGEDPHIWLDPDNAAVIVRQMSRSLRELDGENSAIYRANSAALLRRLNGLSKRIESQLGDVKDRPFVVLHDAYRHFGQRFGLSQAGALSLNAELPVGAKGLSAIKRMIAANNVVCVFGEARAAPASLNIAAEGTSARTGRLGALGLDIAPGPEAYFQLLTGLAGEFRRCLGGRQ
jgi:zinc transport system substrate-binding protein